LRKRSGLTRGLPIGSITSEIFRRTEVNYAYNGKVYNVNNTLQRILCTRNDITYWSHKGLWQNIPDLLLNDLVHLNQEGLEIYARNVRAAVGSQQIGTRTLRHLCETSGYHDKSTPGQSALVFFSLILRTKLPIALNQFSNFNHVCSGKDLYHVDSNPDPRSVIDEKKRLILFVFLVMLMFALYTIMLRIVILMFCNPFFCILSFNNCV